MKRKDYVFISIFAMSLFFVTQCFAAGTLVVEAVGDGAIYVDGAFTEVLPKGSLVQIVLDRDGDGLDTIEFSGSVYPDDDDVLLPVLSGSNTFRVGDGLPPFAKAGQFSVVVTFDNEDPDPNYSGYKVYIRYWNAAEPKVGSMYGEAGPYTLKSGMKPEKINVIGEYDLSTDKVLK